MRAFHVVDGRYVAGLDATEREVLATIVADVAGLLGADRFGGSAPDPQGADAEHVLLGLRMSPAVVPAPVDPAVHRLLPDASTDDPDLAAEFRRLTEGDLRAAKIDRLRTLWRALADDAAAGDLVVRREEAEGLAATLTDVRLVLADRLGVSSQEESDALYDELERHERGDEVPDRSGREELQDEIRTYLGSLYAALSWLQESLMTVMLADLP